MREQACRSEHCGFTVYILANIKGWQVEVSEYGGPRIFYQDGIDDLLKAVALGFAAAEWEATRRTYVQVHGYSSDKVLAVLGMRLEHEPLS